MRAARAFITRGWPVFPLTLGGKKPLRHCNLCSTKSPDYEPHRSIDDCPHPPDVCHGFHAATTDEDRVRDWFRRFPELNLGINTELARLVVVDLDTNKDGDPAPAPYNLPGVHDGRDVFALCLERYEQPFPSDTLSILTPSRGVHLYWQLPDGVTVNKSEGTFGWNIDVRAAGSYIVAPTSSTPDGEYQRLGDIVDPAPAPAWLLHHLEGTGHMPKPPTPRPIYRGQSRANSGRRKTLDDLAAELGQAPVSQRHKVLCTVTTAAAHLVAEGLCSEADVYAAIEPAGRAAERGEYEIRDAIASAFDFVARKGAA
jgi:hypothetical protein